MPGELTPDLERLALRAIVEEYEQINYSLFADRLRMPALHLSSSGSQLGSWQSSPPTLILSRKLLLDHPWPTLVEVLKHEMAHQFVEQVLGVNDQTAHGPVFRRVCQERGVDAAAAGAPRARSASDSSIFNKVRQLLSLAQSGERHEAEAAAAAAQRLMLKYNLRMVDEGGTADYCYAHLGTPSGRIQEGQRSLARLLGEFFFVETIWVSAFRPLEGKRGNVLEVCGSTANVELASYVYGFLDSSAERLWKQHKKANQIAGNRDRRRFIAGVVSGFYGKLKRERVAACQEGIVWLGDPELKNYYRRRFPKVTTVRYGTSSGSSAHSAGRQAGERLVLHRGVSSGPKGVTRLLRGG